MIELSPSVCKHTPAIEQGAQDDDDQKEERLNKEGPEPMSLSPEAATGTTGVHQMTVTAPLATH